MPSLLKASSTESVGFMVNLPSVVLRSSSWETSLMMELQGAEGPRWLWHRVGQWQCPHCGDHGWNACPWSLRSPTGADGIAVAVVFLLDFGYLQPNWAWLCKVNIEQKIDLWLFSVPFWSTPPIIHFSGNVSVRDSGPSAVRKQLSSNMWGKIGAQTWALQRLSRKFWEF